MATKLKINHISKFYGKLAAAADVSLELAEGELVTLLGPSGSGKTTTMMMVAGFEKPDSGNILLDGKSLLNVPPHKRDIGVVFQNYALFPHMTVFSNVEFPLRERGIAKAAARKRTEEMLDLVGLAGFELRKIGQLSGGQQQRVALARALIFNPPLLIMDEPLSALDKRLREQMQFEIRRIQKLLGITVLCVTHDQAEAFALSDRIAIMNHGRILQVGAPREIYGSPADNFSAQFLGESNIVPGLTEHVDGRAFLTTPDGIRLAIPRAPESRKDISVLIRPERIALHAAGSGVGGGESPDHSVVSGTVETASFAGDTTFYRVRANETVFTVRTPNDGRKEVRAGDDVLLVIGQDACIYIPA